MVRVISFKDDVGVYHLGKNMRWQTSGEFGNGQSAGKCVMMCHMESATFGRKMRLRRGERPERAGGLERSGIRDLIAGISSDLFFLPPWPPTSLSFSCL